MVNTYVAVDLETTGLDPKRDKMIEIGGVKVIDGCIVEEFSALIDPKRRLLPLTVELTGITDQMVQGCPVIEEKIQTFMDFCQGFPLLGHHIIFDYSFLKRAAANCGLAFEKEGIDTLALCRVFMPDTEKKNLGSACRFFEVPHTEAHRAVADARAAHLLYQRLKQQFGQHNSEVFSGKPLNYKVKRDRQATKRQKEHLRELAKYHRIDLSVEIEYLTGNEISRMTDKIISQYGRILKR